MRTWLIVLTLLCVAGWVVLGVMCNVVATHSEAIEELQLFVFGLEGC